MTVCETRCARAFELSSLLLALANEVRGDCEHDGCLLLDGVVRDCALRIRQAASAWRREIESETSNRKEELLHG